MRQTSFAKSLAFTFVALGGVLHSVIAAAPQASSGFLDEYAETYGYRLGRPTAIQITPSDDAVLFLRSDRYGRVQHLYEFDGATGEERQLASAEQLRGREQEDLTPEERARRERMRLSAEGIASYRVSQDGSQVLIPLGQSLYLLDRASKRTRKLNCGKGSPIDARFSPDGKQVAMVRNGDLYVYDCDVEAEIRLTHGANKTLSNGLAEFVAQEEMDRMSGYWWSPDSQQIAYQETDTSGVELLHISDPTRPNNTPQSWRYPRPGKANAEVRLGVIDATGGDTQWIEWNRKAYPYVAKVTWEENSPLTILVQNRTQTQELLLAVNPSNGSTSRLLEETDSAWINIDAKMPYWLPDGESFLWASERTGAWRLERRQRASGHLQILTQEDFRYRELVGVDASDNSAIVIGGENPTQSHVYRVTLDRDGPPPRQITREPGVHWAVTSKKSGLYVIGGHTLEGEQPTSVYRRNGSLVGVLQNVGVTPPLIPHVELTIVGEDPKSHAAIVRPQTFDAEAGRQYPVVVSVYGGPHSQKVTASAQRYLLSQWIADHGFIVVSIDGRGTPSRGRKWERAIKGNLIETPLSDQVAGLQALGERYSEMDMSRVGIHGWSFGGYFSAMAVMQRPDVFHVGVAGAPVVDWRDYDTHYTERYMGFPADNPDGYDAASVLSYTADLRRPLLLIHGTSDDNVYFLHSAKAADALFRHGKTFDFLPLVGSTHMVTEPALVKRLNGRIVDYLSKHLLDTTK